MASIATTTPITVNRSPKIVIAPLENNSCSTSTSLPTRVIDARWDSGRSRKGWASIRSKTASRRSIIAAARCGR
jgi:hypothetical protein